jgi:hypothetical protein
MHEGCIDAKAVADSGAFWKENSSENHLSYLEKLRRMDERMVY